MQCCYFLQLKYFLRFLDVHCLLSGEGSSLETWKLVLYLSRYWDCLIEFSLFVHDNFVSLLKCPECCKWLNMIDLICFRNLSENNFPELPTMGLQTVKILSIRHNSKLLKFPSPRHLPSVKVLRLYYPYHCCAFLNQKNEMHYNYHSNTTQVSTCITRNTCRTPRLASKPSKYNL